MRTICQSLELIEKNIKQCFFWGAFFSFLFSKSAQLFRTNNKQKCPGKSLFKFQQHKEPEYSWLESATLSQLAFLGDSDLEFLWGKFTSWTMNHTQCQQLNNIDSNLSAEQTNVILYAFFHSEQKYMTKSVNNNKTRHTHYCLWSMHVVSNKGQMSWQPFPTIKESEKVVFMTCFQWRSWHLCHRGLMCCVRQESLVNGCNVCTKWSRE